MNREREKEREREQRADVILYYMGWHAILFGIGATVVIVVSGCMGWL